MKCCDRSCNIQLTTEGNCKFSSSNCDDVQRLVDGLKRIKPIIFDICTHLATPQTSSSKWKVKRTEIVNYPVWNPKLSRLKFSSSIFFVVRVFQGHIKWDGRPTWNAPLLDHHRRVLSSSSQLLCYLETVKSASENYKPHEQCQSAGKSNGGAVRGVNAKVFHMLYSGLDKGRKRLRFFTSSRFSSRKRPVMVLMEYYRSQMVGSGVEEPFLGTFSARWCHTFHQSW